MTHCDECEHVHDKKLKWYRWTCIKHKRMEGFGFVKHDVRETEPYLFCKDVNGGACPLFEKEKGKQTDLNLKGEE